MRSFISFGEIVAIRQVESGFDRLIEIETRAGAVHHMTAQLLPDTYGRLVIDDTNGLHAFDAAIRNTMQVANVPPPVPQEGLSFWNTVGGLALLGVLFALTLVIAALVAWNFWLGSNATGAILTGAIILVMLPLGTGYLFVKAARRRARLLNR